MIIANPIYDVVFKRLMEDKRIAKFFIETLTGECKKVLIEIQKARNALDLMRFRNYLAEQYKKEDEVDTGYETTRMTLPIITIYLLGFRLNEVETSVFKVNRQYVDLITNTIIEQKSDFIEKLTHDCYVVQIPRIQPRLQSRPEMILTVFEQNNFTDDREITKNYPYQVDDELMKEMIAILHHAGTWPDQRKEIENEQEAFRVFELNFGKLRRAIEEKDKAIAENKKTISEKEKALTEKDKLIEDLKRRLGGK